MTSGALNELDKEEWWDVARRVRPDITREEYDRMWEEFQVEKEARLRQREMH